MTFCKAVPALAVLLLAFALSAFAQGTYTQIDYPGAVRTSCNGIDAAGDIVGAYVDAGGIESGFLLSGGTYTSVSYDGLNSGFSGINDLGQVVGSSTGGGFVYDLQTQTFTTIAYPGTHGPTAPLGINNAGTVAGFYLYHDRYQGFELVGSTYSQIALRGALDTYAYGITSTGKVVGYANIRRLGLVNFSFAQAKYQELIIPNAPEADVFGVNPAGSSLVGVYAPSSGVAAGFVYQNKTLTTLQFPGSTQTFAYGINAAGKVVGYFYDSSGNVHGFTWTPPAPAGKK